MCAKFTDNQNFKFRSVTARQCSVYCAILQMMTRKCSVILRVLYATCRVDV